MERKRKHILLVTYPAYGLMIPLLEFARKLSTVHDVTFAVSAEMIEGMRKRELILDGETIAFYAIPDGISTEHLSLLDGLKLVQPAVEKLIDALPHKDASRTTTESDMRPVDVVVADTYILTAAKGCIAKAIPLYQFEAAAVSKKISITPYHP